MSRLAFFKNIERFISCKRDVDGFLKDSIEMTTEDHSWGSGRTARFALEKPSECLFNKLGVIEILNVITYSKVVSK